MRLRRVGRHWYWPRGWVGYFDALGYVGCPRFQHNWTWRDA